MAPESSLLHSGMGFYFISSLYFVFFHYKIFLFLGAIVGFGDQSAALQIEISCLFFVLGYFFSFLSMISFRNYPLSDVIPCFVS